MWPWRVRMPTQNLLRLLLFLMLMLRNVLTIVWCRFGSWSLAIKSHFVQTLRTRFGQNLLKAGVKAQARFRSWSWVSILLLGSVCFLIFRGFFSFFLFFLSFCHFENSIDLQCFLGGQLGIRIIPIVDYCPPPTRQASSTIIDVQNYYLLLLLLI